MKRKPNLPLIAWIGCLCVMLAAMSLAAGIQNDFGNIEITTGALEADGGSITYKLYRPVSATADTPAPAVLLMHGYQNDRDTSAAYALELARRGSSRWPSTPTATVPRTLACLRADTRTISCRAGIRPSTGRIATC